MMSRTVFARTLSGSSSTENWQTLSQHASGVAYFAENFAATFDSGLWGRNLGWLHDLGKIDSRFQRKLHDACDIPYPGKAASGNVNHSNSGAAYAETRLPPGIGRTLAYIVAGHHAGLPDYWSTTTAGAAWSARLEEAVEDLERIESETEPYTGELSELKSPPPFVNQSNYHLWIRMLFSCLVDADWLDSERFADRKKFDSRPEFPTFSVLSEMFEEYMKAKRKDSPRKPLNILRDEILEHCRAAAKNETGLFALTVPTGGGKTLSSMALALEHAKRHDKKHIIYVIPYTSIIEQTAREFREIFGTENVLEHHSNVVRDAGKAMPDEHHPLDLAAENWDAPIIVTTNVQFFESLYAARPRRCRKLHNIADAVVLIDEAQLIPPEYLDPCVDVLKHLAGSFKTTVVLCTATQSRPKELAFAREIVPEPQGYYSALKRTKIHFPENIQETTPWEELAGRVLGHDKVLCIVNTRLDCRRLYDMLREKDPENTVHLSALMCGEHRTGVIDEIKRRLKDKNDKRPLRVVSTQLVEAGVDIDFPVVYRALAGLDSIVQAAGRCNREGSPEPGQVYVFVPPNRTFRGLMQKGIHATSSLIRRGKTDTDDPDLFAEYFADLYDRVNQKEIDGKKILDLLKCDRHYSVFFRTVGEHFQLIEDECNVPILVKYGKGRELIETLDADGPNRDLMKKLQRYTINLDKRRAGIFCQSGLIRAVDFYNGRDSVLVQNIDSCYKDDVGFDIMQQELASEDGII